MRGLKIKSQWPELRTSLRDEWKLEIILSLVPPNPLSPYMRQTFGWVTRTPAPIPSQTFPVLGAIGKSR